MQHDLNFHAIKAIEEKSREARAEALGIDPLKLYYFEKAKAARDGRK